MTRSKKIFIFIGGFAIVTCFILIAISWDLILREYEFKQKFEFIEVNEQGFKEFRHLKSGIVMVLLPGGEYTMGLPEEKEWWRGAEEVKKVKISSFLIAKYELSQGDWDKVMESNPSKEKDPDLPVTNVSYMDCYGNDDSFCKKLGLQLPTEAQWEYACRAGTPSEYSFGDWLKPTQANCSFAYPNPAEYKSQNEYLVAVNDFSKVASFNLHLQSLYMIGLLTANDWGLHDMHGNVWEICSDKIQFNELNDKYKSIIIMDSTVLRVRRGGSYIDPVFLCSSSYRSAIAEDVRDDRTGFRPVYVFDS